MATLPAFSLLALKERQQAPLPNRDDFWVSPGLCGMGRSSGWVKDFLQLDLGREAIAQGGALLQGRVRQRSSVFGASHSLVPSPHHHGSWGLESQADGRGRGDLPAPGVAGASWLCFLLEFREPGLCGSFALALGELLWACGPQTGSPLGVVFGCPCSAF